MNRKKAPKKTETLYDVTGDPAYKFEEDSSNEYGKVLDRFIIRE